MSIVITKILKYLQFEDIMNKTLTPFVAVVPIPMYKKYYFLSFNYIHIVNVTYKDLVEIVTVLILSQNNFENIPVVIFI